MKYVRICYEEVVTTEVLVKIDPEQFEAIMGSPLDDAPMYEVDEYAEVHGEDMRTVREEPRGDYEVQWYEIEGEV